MSISTVSPKYQVVIPKPVRERLRIKRGDKVWIKIITGNRAAIIKQPKSIVDEMYGLGSDMWESLGGADKYVEQERNSWDE